MRCRCSSIRDPTADVVNHDAKLAARVLGIEARVLFRAVAGVDACCGERLPVTHGPGALLQCKNFRLFDSRMQVASRYLMLNVMSEQHPAARRSSVASKLKVPATLSHPTGAIHATAAEQ